jgi:DinB superfamily
VLTCGFSRRFPAELPAGPPSLVPIVDPDPHPQPAPLVLVMYTIVAGAGIFTKAAARRQAVDVRTMIDVPGWGRTLLASIVAGGCFAVLSVVSSSASWRDASVQGAFFGAATGRQGLTDDEFFWEPFTTTWSIRRQDQCRTPNPFGVGEWVADFEIPEPTPVPMTTIAWLYWHIGSMPGRLCDIDLLGGTRTMASGWTSPYLTHHPIFTSAAEAVSQLRDGWQRLRGAIERAGDDQLEVTTAGYTYAAEPPRGGLCVAGPPGPAHPATHFIAGTLTEVGHHGTQIGALRDVYAWRRLTAADTAT